MHITLSPLDAVSIAIHEAANKYLPVVHYTDRDWSKFKETGEHVEVQKMRRPEHHEVFVEAMFPQTWPNTSCGHNGMAGKAITSTYTVVVAYRGDRNVCAVFLGGRHAYTVKIDEVFMDDMKRCMLQDVKSAPNHYQIIQ